MIVDKKDINSLARVSGPDSLAVVTSVRLPNLPIQRLPRFPYLPKEVPAYATGSGLGEFGGAELLKYGVVAVGLVWLWSMRKSR